MPELPEVETVVSGLQNSIIGKAIKYCYFSGVTFRGKKIIIEPNYLMGASIKSCKRRAKYILINLSTGYTLLLHLGMSGKILLGSERLKHDHLVLIFSDNSYLRFNDPRRFGIIKLIQSDEVNQDNLLKNLGFEPLEDGFDINALQNICKNKASPIKSVLLNSNLIAGIGNIYASEALYDAGILPTRYANSLKLIEVAQLRESIIKILKLAIHSGGSTLRDYVRSDGNTGYFQHQFKVYGKNGSLCSKCNSSIQKIIISNRSTFFCSNCQS